MKEDEYEYKLRLVASTGAPKTIMERVCETFEEAKALAFAWAKDCAMTNPKIVSDFSDWDGWRVTATTPGGRAGRNIAFIDMC